jgi:8-oxo-dGTP pyrophosphatase MutT (NUDIX family)
VGSEDTRRDAVASQGQTDKKVGGPDLAIAESSRLVECQLYRPLGTRRQPDLAGHRLGARLDDVADCPFEVLRLRAGIGQDRPDGLVVAAHETEQQVFGPDVAVMELQRLQLGDHECRSESVTHPAPWQVDVSLGAANHACQTLNPWARWATEAPKAVGSETANAYNRDCLDRGRCPPIEWVPTEEEGDRKDADHDGNQRLRLQSSRHFNLLVSVTCVTPVRCRRMDDQASPWQRLSRRKIYDNPWITVWHDDVIRPDGEPGIYGVVHYEHQAVGVVPIDAEYRVVLVRQYRYTMEAYSWEIPEGGSPWGEDPLEGARRELREETGYEATEWRQLGRLDLSNSISDETAVLYVATGLAAGEARPDGTEDLRMQHVAFDEVLAMTLDGRITDAMTVAAIQWVALARQGLGPVPAAATIATGGGVDE